MDSKAYLSFRYRSKDTTSKSVRTNLYDGKDGKVGLMKLLQQNRRRMTSSQSCYYQPGGGLTCSQNLKMIFTNANPQYTWKLDDPQEDDTTMQMEQVRDHES